MGTPIDGYSQATLKSFQRSDALIPFIQKKEDRRYHVTCKPSRLHMVQRFFLKKTTKKKDTVTIRAFAADSNILFYLVLV